MTTVTDLSAGALQRINPEEELMKSRWWKDGRLHDIYAAPTDVFFDPNEQIPV